MRATFFISDLHLDIARADIQRAFARFLHDIRHCDALYILGDLFEAWVGDDDDAELATETGRLLRQFSDAGPALYLLQGNRDFLLGAEFCSRAGASLLPDPSRIDLYGMPTLLLHGDSLCTRDAPYQAFRSLSRTPRWRADVLAKSLAERRALAREMRRISHEAQSNQPEDIVDVTPAEVHRVMAEHGVQQLIHGHTHRPACHAEPGGLRWVLGAWDASALVLRASPEGN
ncbi:MAG: UDP-2,3-diacylglucosamine diphosphatase [Halioglobus sp.]